MHQNAGNLRNDFCGITVDTLYILIYIASKLNIADFWVCSEEERSWNDRSALKDSYYE
jgi:hypothetical protein